MKICFLTHNVKSDNGAGVFSQKIISFAKRELNVEVEIFVTDSDDSDNKQIFNRQIGRLKSLLNIRRAFKTCDIVHALDTYPYGVLAAILLLGIKRPLIITAVGTGAIGHLYRKKYFWLMKYAYRKADKVVAISNFTKREILKKVKEINIDVINHGVDKKLLKPVTDDGSLNVAKDFKPYILSVGSLRYRKGYRLSIPVFKMVNDRFPDLNYVIVGKIYAESEIKRLKNLAKELGVEDKVFFLTEVNSPTILQSLYQNAELFILMSQNTGHDVEGFGLVFLEAAANKLPVVGTKDCGIEDATLDGQNGYLVEENDVEGTANRVIEILSDQNLRDTMSLSSKKLAEKMTWDNMLVQYKKIYEKLVS